MLYGGILRKREKAAIVNGVPVCEKRGERGNMRRRIWQLTAILAFCCMAAGLGGLVREYWIREQEQRDYESLASEVRGIREEIPGAEPGIEGEETLGTWSPEALREKEQERGEGAEEPWDPDGVTIDFEALRAVNPDVVGWIIVPGTSIDYPILQGRDNEEYLHKNVRGAKSVAGAIYLDSEDKKDFSSLHNILYGHHMRNGIMFSDITQYKEQDYFDTHRDIYIYTPEGMVHLKALAALYTTPDAARRQIHFKNEDEFELYIKEMTAGAQAKASEDAEIHRLYSFVTCSYEIRDGRTILYAYEADEG